MQTLGFAVVGVVVLGLALARFIDRRDSIVADRARFASHSVLRIFVALYCGWVALVAARHDDAPHITRSRSGARDGLGDLHCWALRLGRPPPDGQSRRMTRPVATAALAS